MKNEPRGKVKLLSDHDVEEVVRFQEYLGDIGKLKPRDFVAKYREYMGLSDAEAAAYVKREVERMKNEPVESRPDICPHGTIPSSSCHTCAVASRSGETAQTFSTKQIVEIDRMSREVAQLAMELARFVLQSPSVQISEHSKAVRIRDVCYTLLGTKHHKAKPAGETAQTDLREKAEKFIEQRLTPPLLHGDEQHQQWLREELRKWIPDLETELREAAQHAPSQTRGPFLCKHGIGNGPCEKCAPSASEGEKK